MSTEVIDKATTPPTAEITSVWLTPGSVKPIWLAVTILCALAGLFAFRPLLLVSVAVGVMITWSWLSEARAQSNELPLN